MKLGRARLFKIFQVILVYSAIALVVSQGILWMHYYDTRPHFPEAVSGRTIPLNTHGIAVYATKQEYSRLQALMWVSGACFVVGIGIEILKTRGRFLQPRR